MAEEKRSDASKELDDEIASLKEQGKQYTQLPLQLESQEPHSN